MMEVVIKLEDKFKELSKKYQHLLKPLIVVMLIYFITFLAIIRVNYNYGDDVERVMYGLRGWTNFSRFTTETLSVYIHTSNYLTDISPLTQLLAIIFLTLSSTILLKLFKKDKRITLMNIISVMFVGICPYFLSCFSYKFDSPYMALSILVSIFPFVFYKENNADKFDKILYSLAVIFGTILMCTTYQAASGIIPLVTIFLSFNLWNDKKEKKALNLIITTSINYFIGLLIFKLFILRSVSNYASDTMFSIGEMIPGFFKNLLKYYEHLINDFRIIWLIFIGILLIVFIINKTINSKHNKKLAFIMSLLLVLLSFLVVFGLYPCLEKTLFATRAMYSVGTLISLYAINITVNKGMYFSKFIVFCLAWCFITFSFTYGNCLSMQKDYINFRTQMIFNGLNELEMINFNDKKTIKLEGNMGVAPAIENMPDKYRNFIKRLMIQPYWEKYYLAKYFNSKNTNIYINDKEVIYGLKLVKDTMYYSIKSNPNNNFILLTLK